ncbi:hypothetical protein IEQ34_002437 [Dendrobium chrysotoxum]|uniref:Uncharacterized protein n=1 Tax=Dendrobium chrysotoxum TaxID=161865 RepID=A0AAV7HPK1_DENCH|nr:hypothetical protein IEQ34_002437 [Dendrobium chrysotoxum]
MVVHINPKAWLADSRHLAVASSTSGTSKRSTIGILAFETATTMSRLLSLHHTLSDPSLRLLRSDTMRSPGIAYLTSTDQHFLFRLVFSDMLSDLDSSAAAVSRLTSRCHSRKSFSLTYTHLKSGRIPITHSYSSKEINRRVKQMEKSIALVAELLEEMEILDNMAKKKPPPPPPTLEAQLKSQRKKVARIKEESLWNKTFDEVVSLMSRAIIAIFARICIVFSPFVSGLPPVIVRGGRFSFTPFSSRCRIYPRLSGRHHASGPMERYLPKEVAIRNSCPIIGRGRETEPKITNTVGRAGLATRYANVVLTAERLLRMRCGEQEAEEGEEAAAREEIYRQLPINLQGMVKGKLMERWRERGLADGELAKGWKEAVERILRWLGPVARDTVTWQEEKTLDRRRRLDARPKILAIQTLEFSDKEKTETAIVEVLVGISCMCWYDGRTAEAAAPRCGRRDR